MTATTATSTAATGSRTTRLLGALALVGVGVLALFAFVFTEADIVQGDAVRIMYVHVSVAIMAYVGFVICAGASIMVLARGADQATWWDLVASSAAEIGTLFAGLTLISGSIYGRPTWNTWWEWGDVKLMTTLMMFLVYVGYLAYRRVVPTAESRARRSAIIGVVAVLNIPIVNRSVEWWENRTLHQQSTLEEGRMEDLTLFTLMLGIVVIAMIFAWMLIHRFRVGWLEHQHETIGLEAALAERRAQLDGDVESAVAHPGLTGDRP